MKLKSKILLVGISIIGMAACNKDKNKQKVEGYKPIYAEAESLNSVEIKHDQPLVNPGRIYTYENLLLVNEQGLGIHIYDNANPANPVELSFVEIQGNMDFSVSGDKLYADNLTDMVIVDIAEPASPQYVNRVSGIFPIQQFPDERGAFECADPKKGIVVGWEKTMLDNPKCNR